MAAKKKRGLPPIARPDRDAVREQTGENDRDKSSQETQESPGKNSPESALTVVGIGASAGGLEAFTELLEHLPTDTGMAFVLLQHLDPRHKSSLPEILARSTQMSVDEVRDGMPLQRNRIYVAPSNTELGLINGALHLLPRPESSARHMPIDSFFRALAEDQGPKAVGVVLSGTGSDGALGLRDIKATGGVTMVQDQESAKYGGMPAAAADVDEPDVVLPPKGIAQELARIHEHRPGRADADAVLAGADALQKVFLLLRRATGVDFTHYKRTTIERRIARRMLLQKTEKLDHYVRYLQETPAEVQRLFHDMLITVTSFFRDPETFEALKQQVFPRIVEDRSAEAPIRIWVPACSTGEEVYSIAMAITEYLAAYDAHAAVQIFATDVSEEALERARFGKYPENIAHDVSPQRLRRFFQPVGGGYQINKTIRDMCVFARQNVVKDPPFSRIDLVSCRNLLIYLGRELQHRVVPALHYSLNPGGFLMLGTSETIGGFPELFSLVDKKQKIYKKKTAVNRPPLSFGGPEFGNRPEPAARKRPEAPRTAADLQRAADRYVLEKFAPSGVVVDEDMQILQFRGEAGRFLTPAPGDASLNLLKMAREGLLIDLRAAIHQASKQRVTIEKQGLRVKYDSHFLNVDLEVIPLGPKEADQTHFLVLFHERAAMPASEKAPPTKPPTKDEAKDEAQRELAHLREELASTKRTLQTIIEEYEATNEELRGANEEIQSGNEELQSTNEELETAKEELQSTNEELTTLNEELENRNDELNLALNDVRNLLSSVDISIVMLDRELRIRMFTPVAEKVLGLRSGDVGRSVTELNLGIQVDRLQQQVEEVLDRLETKETAITTRNGSVYLMRTRPYRSVDDRIDGAVVALVDITEREATQQALEEARVYAESIVDAVREPLIVLDGNLRVVSANPAFYRTFHVERDATEGRLIYELGNGQWDIPPLRTLLEEIIPRDAKFDDFEVEHEFPEIGHRKMVLNARRIDQGAGRKQLILLAMEDVTDDT